MKSDLSPIWLTYHMLKWDAVEQHESEQKCTECGRPLMKTELVTDQKGTEYEGYVCHADKQVTWVKVG